MDTGLHNAEPWQDLVSQEAQGPLAELILISMSLQENHHHSFPGQS